MSLFGLVKGGPGFFISLEILRTDWSFSTVPRRYPTNEQQVESYATLTIGLVGHGFVCITDGKSTADMTVEEPNDFTVSL